MTRSTRRSTPHKFYLALALVAVVGAGWIGYTVWRKTPESPAAATPAPLTAPQGSFEGGIELGVPKGDLNAPLVVQEYADYQCPYCAQFAALTARALDEQYVKPGKLRWVFFDFPLSQHRNALPAAEAARCAGEQGQYWPMHDVLFARQAEWSNERSAKGKFKEYANALGLDTKAFEACLDSGRHRAVIQQSYDRGIRLGVESTPTFFVGRVAVRGAISYEDFVRLVEEGLARAGTP